MAMIKLNCTEKDECRPNINEKEYIQGSVQQNWEKGHRGKAIIAFKFNNEKGELKFEAFSS